ncbi:hypothetical protein MMC06_003639 [Schaereria dolodes]|nr:hypothetical protein [Schaereria dolodes]
MLASTPAAAKLNSIDHQNEAESPVESAEIVTATTEDPKITELLNSVEQTLVKKTKEKSESVAEPPKNWFQSEESKRSVEEQRMIAESNAKPPPKPKTVPEMSEAIVHVLGKYRLAHHSDTKKWSAKGKFLAQVEKFVAKNEPVRLVLPAFPFKSPNKKTKVLGTLPDAGEEMALAHLQGFASAIADVYKPGANILIVSDGLVYNDILGVSDQEVWRYGQALRQIAKDKDFNNLNFLRLRDMIDGEDLQEPLSEEDYLRDAPRFREALVQQHLPAGYDAEKQVNNDADTAITYKGYVKFLEIDLASNSDSMTKAQKKENHEEIAKKMIMRGKAFAAAIAKKNSEFVRLSIHPSTETTKLSMSLIPQEGRVQTPWHSSLVRAVDGTITMSHAASVSAMTHELIFENGRPTHFRERSELFNWPGMDVEFKYQYPTGMIISAREPNTHYSLQNVHMQKVRQLATACSPVILRGFSDTTNEHIYTAKAYDAGVPSPWTFGVKTSVKDSRGSNPDPVTAIVTSSEAMPMHYDGFFFLIPKVQPDGTTKMVSSQPRYQYFSAVSPSTPGSGYTLFASSPLIFKNLPQPTTVEDLRKLTWDCRHSSNWDEHMNNLPMIGAHPETGEDCLRYHEPWPQWKTKFTYNRISIENGDQSYIDLIDEMLYDRRVCLYFEWTQGDVLVSDNIKMLHTRTAFDAKEDRELWRIHFN